MRSFTGFTLEIMGIPPVTISVAFVSGLLSGLRANGMSCDAQLIEAGIPPSLLKEPEGRVTADQYIALYRVLMELSNDEAVGLFSRPIRRGSLALVMRGTMIASTVESALRRLGDGLHLIQDDALFEIVKENERTGLRIFMAQSSGPDRLVQFELLMRVCSRFIVWLHGGRLRPVGFDFALPSPPQVDEYYKLFPGDVRFDQPRSVMWFRTADLLVPIRRDDAALREFMSHTMRNVILPRRHEGTTSKRIRAYLQQVRPNWPDLPATAAAMHMSMSTLQKHLANEETSFQVLKDQLRRDLAIMRLNTTSTSLIAIADELGFSDQAVFQRAFKLWTGSAPGAYRNQLK